MKTAARTVGFTGTRKGMTAIQMSAVMECLDKLPGALEVHHGCCVGADAELVRYLSELNKGERAGQIKIIGHPSTVRGMVDEESVELSHELTMPGAPLDRNKRIVLSSSFLLACPDTDEEQLRSGTWMTVRYAARIARPVRVVGPTGAVRPYRAGMDGTLFEQLQHADDSPWNDVDPEADR
jgi:hypothetical protein